MGVAGQGARGAFVGRDDELHVVRSALEESAAGRGSLVVLAGETGIGKTRLLEEAVHLARATHVVLSGRAVEGGGAYRPIADALVGALRAGRQVDPGSLGGYAPVLARLLPDWRDLAVLAADTGVDQGLVLGEAVARFLAAVGLGHPCLLVLEDLHWADADSLAVVTHLAGAVEGLPVLVLASVRDDEPGTRVGRGLARLPGVTSVVLDRLSPDEVRLLATSALGGADPHVLELLDRAEGLPFLAQELLALPAATGSEEPLPASLLPPTLLALVGERMAALSPSQRTVLSGAAVLGLDPDWSLLGEVTATSEQEVVDALALAASVRLLDAGAGSLRWHHALTRDAVLAGVLPPQREGLARRAAEVLRARGREDDDATAAQLLLDAGAADAAADLLLALAGRHQDQGAYRTAEQNLDDLDRTGLRPVESAVERVRLLCRTGRAAEALDAGEPVVDGPKGRSTSTSPWGSRAPPCCAGSGPWPRSTSRGPDAPTTRGRGAFWPTPRTEQVTSRRPRRVPRTPSALPRGPATREPFATRSSSGRRCARARPGRRRPALRPRGPGGGRARPGRRPRRGDDRPGDGADVGTERIDLLLPARELAASAGLVGQLTAVDLHPRRGPHGAGGPRRRGAAGARPRRAGAGAPDADGPDRRQVRDRVSSGEQG